MDCRLSRSCRGLLAAASFAVAGQGGLRGFAQPDDSPPDYPALRETMVAQEIAAAGVKNPRVLAALRQTPRHEFVPADMRRYAYFDAALPIGDAQTISPPYVVASMTEALDPQPAERVLEIGTGSGYQAAVLSPLAAEVFTIEIVPRLGRRAEALLKRLGYRNVHVRVGDGFLGWPEKGPFDKIIVTCSPENVPAPLVEQLKEGGRMIIPVGERYQQNLVEATKRNGKLQRKTLQATLFVPMTGQAESARAVLPDPLHPRIRNGGFETLVGQSQQPAGWHYLRQAEAIADAAAPEGQRLLRFASDEPGKASQALQGFAVDGRQVSRLDVSCRVHGTTLQRGPTEDAAAALIVTFYDGRRAAVDSQGLGPWQGDFAWRQEKKSVPVPLAAREAIVRIGLLGATGRLEIDDVRLESRQALPDHSPASPKR